MAIAAYQHTIALEAVVVKRDQRQRRELVGVESLADSIERAGLFHPIIIGRSDKELIAGETRLAAFFFLRDKHQKLGTQPNPYQRIPFRYFDSISPIERQLVELDENVRRSAMTWQDTASAVLRMHELCLEMGGTGTLLETANRIGASETYVANHVRVGRALRLNDDPNLNTCAGITAALNYLERKVTRQVDSGISALLSGRMRKNEEPAATNPAPVPSEIEQLLAEQPATTSPKDSSPESDDDDDDLSLDTPAQPTHNFFIRQDDFTQWAPKYNGPPFNLIHCDFPYGINFDRHKGQGTAVARERYQDDPEVYWSLCRTLAKNLPRLLGTSGHIMFWFSMDHYAETIAFFENQVSGLVIDRFPLIWMRNKSILPSADYGARRGYETALLMSIGRRHIVRPVINIIECNEGGGKDNHISTKPIPVLEHFFRMLVDKSTRILDPTAGSGSALIAARKHGATFGLGIEINPEFATRAKQNLDLIGGA